MAAYMRLLYRKPATIIFTCVGIIYAAFLLAGIVPTNDNTYYYSAWFLVLYAIFIPVAGALIARRHYTSNKAMQHERVYVFDDEKISYSGDGLQGYLEWKHFTKYRRVKHFLLLYMATKQAIFLKTDNLTEEQIAFIQSKIKQP